MSNAIGMIETKGFVAALAAADAMVKAANGATHCRPGELAGPATTMMQRSAAPWVWMASMARRTLELFWPTAT